MSRRTSLIAVTILVFGVFGIGTLPEARAAEAAATTWAAWRGPLGTGVSLDGNPPIHWSEEQNIRFKVEVPGRGLSSPVIWKDTIFLMSTESLDADAYAANQKAAAEVLERKEWPPDVAPVRQRFLLLAYSRLNGQLLWQRTASEHVPHESHYLDSSWASGSPVTDGKRVIAHFGSNGTYAYDLNGKLLWKTDLGEMTTRRGFGEGSSPTIHGNTLIINWDHEGESFLTALNIKNGKQRWKVDRPDEVTSWSTPLVVPYAGDRGRGHQIVIASTGRSRGYDLKTGREIWSLGGMTVNTIPTPVHRDGVVYLASGYRGNMMQAVALDRARGRLEDTDAVLWTHERHTPYVPSLLLYDDRVYFVKHFRNILTSLKADDGEIVFTEQRLPGINNVYASPVGAAGRIYLFGRKGHAVVLEHGDAFKLLAENDLGEGVDASPAIVGDTLYVRGERHLYAIAE